MQIHSQVGIGECEMQLRAVVEGGRNVARFAVEIALIYEVQAQMFK